MSWSSLCHWTEVTCRPQFAFTCLRSLQWHGCSTSRDGPGLLCSRSLTCVLWCLLIFVLHQITCGAQSLLLGGGDGQSSAAQGTAGQADKAWALLRWLGGTGDKASATCHTHNKGTGFKVVLPWLPAHSANSHEINTSTLTPSIIF